MSSSITAPKRLIFNPLEGQFTLVLDNHFSYESIPAGKRLQIPANQQMVVYEDFVIEGELALYGTLIVEE